MAVDQNVRSAAGNELVALLAGVSVIGAYSLLLLSLCHEQQGTGEKRRK
jgi:hypothetical protein